MPNPLVTYHRPVNQSNPRNSIYFDDYTQYIKDKDLQDYAASVIGSYIEEASLRQQEQVNNVAEKMGLGLNYL
ncbi:MAG TPA: hypothetical protein VJ916_07600, partial [Anaerovoracaceae bacterium]|nr:hypothetical protein [Anaerovoracaceae bacterium]